MLQCSKKQELSIKTQQNPQGNKLLWARVCRIKKKNLKRLEALELLDTKYKISTLKKVKETIKTKTKDQEIDQTQPDEFLKEQNFQKQNTLYIKIIIRNLERHYITD